MKIFINYSNHPSSKWSEEQLSEAKKMADTIIDVQFPQIDPEATEMDIVALAKEQFEMLINLYPDADDIIFHIAGEMTFTAYFVSQVNKYYGYKAICITSTTKRDTVDNPDGSKTVKFKFVRFRQYLTI